ncbi:GxxExxY protein [Pedosphaera parvula]|uniref:GTP-binding signal recognition particle SRP54, G-domain n=1 Tax=Pedosphaera parvula (strain Ellin514) TaxID=320771 RepID=B9XNF9_PEDPL|nr:GxxExxY protein [Pedosphaera parvula]EEF58618.1 GTP-binding signal recognition particle SRP54, G-domain [Pedosphaera parvula Ellin514]
MDTNKLLSKEEVFQIVGCALEVLNEIGPGFHEKIYENSLSVEFKVRHIAFDQQRRFEILYKSQHVGEFIPDLIAFGSVIVDTKVIASIGELERGQMLNHLRITGLRVGVIINFKRAKLEWERLVL